MPARLLRGRPRVVAAAIVALVAVAAVAVVLLTREATHRRPPWRTPCPMTVARRASPPARARA